MRGTGAEKAESVLSTLCSSVSIGGDIIESGMSSAAGVRGLKSGVLERTLNEGDVGDVCPSDVRSGDAGRDLEGVTGLELNSGIDLVSSCEPARDLDVSGVTGRDLDSGEGGLDLRGASTGSFATSRSL